MTSTGCLDLTAFIHTAANTQTCRELGFRPGASLKKRVTSPISLVLYLPMTKYTEADLQFNRETLKCLLMSNKYAWLQSAGDAVSANVLIKLF